MHYSLNQSKKHANNPEFTFGTGKVSVLGGFASAIALGVVAFMMSVESIERMFNPQEIRFNEAIGVALLTREEFLAHPKETTFVGWNVPEITFETKPFKCTDCANLCNVVELFKDNKLAARWGSKCGKWHNIEVQRKATAKDTDVEEKASELDCEVCLEQGVEVSNNNP